MDHMTVRYIAVRVGQRWALVAGHDRFGGRQGFSCRDEDGGWGVSGVSALQAVEMCRSPVTFPTRAAALQSVGTDAVVSKPKPASRGARL